MDDAMKTVVVTKMRVTVAALSINISRKIQDDRVKGNHVTLRKKIE